MNVMASSKIYKNFQTAIPKAIRNEFKDLEKKDIILDWGINENKEIIIRPRRKRTIDDLAGLIDLGYATDSVQLKKELYK